MKQDIAAARNVSDSREDFITIMEDYGYEIARQEANSITWWNKTHTRKIRDRTLGAAYELGTLFAENTQIVKVIKPSNITGSELIAIPENTPHKSATTLAKAGFLKRL